MYAITRRKVKINAWYWSVNDNGVAAGYADVYSIGLRQATVYQPGSGIGFLPPLTVGGTTLARA